MKAHETNPSLLRDLGAVAGLYKNVAWMLSQRVQRGPDWQEKLYEDAVRRDEREQRHREPVLHR